MAHFHDNALVGASGQGGYQISRSLRFNSADSAYLNRTPASAGNRKTWTWSGWVKRSAINGATRQMFGAFSSTTGDGLFFDSNEKVFFTLNGIGNIFVTSQVFRDASAWYHFVLVFDSTSGTTTINGGSTDRARFYVNGFQVSAFSSTAVPSQNADCPFINTTNTHEIGRNIGSTQYFDGYLTEINFVDGQALTPSSFGETDTITGVWKPKKYTGTYGTNGFYLNFSDNSGTTSTTLGKDSSGNGNNWTPNNFSVTAGAGNDSLIDTPTPYADGGNGRGNYCTLNPLFKLDSGTTTFSNGNLEWSNSSAGADGYFAGTQLITTGKYYYEATLSAVGQGVLIGVCRDTSVHSTSNEGCYRNDGSIYNLSSTSQTSGSTYTTNDVIGVAIDVSAGTVQFYKNNTAQGATPSFTFTAGTPLVIRGRSNGNGASLVFNFGQRPFAYTPPSGFVALNTQNLPEPSIKKPSSYMDVVTYTGTGSALTPTSSLGFSPDLVWIKGRSGATDHALYDTVRGVQLDLVSNSTAAETTQTQGLTAFNSNGFNIGTLAKLNTSTATYVAWCWDESATPGFDIVTFTGNGSSPATISHSLGVAPSMMMVKNRDQTGDWVVYHSSITNSQTGGIFLNLANAWGANSTYFNNSVPTSTNFQVGSYFTGNNIKYVAYLWSEVAGFSRFGSYTGNGSSDGPFVFTGMRSRFLLVKRTDVSNNWQIWDTARSSYNAATKFLLPNLSNAEFDFGTTDAVDINANGFKLRASNAAVNASGGTYIFCAFAETSFKFSLAK